MNYDLVNTNFDVICGKVKLYYTREITTSDTKVCIGETKVHNQYELWSVLGGICPLKKKLTGSIKNPHPNYTFLVSNISRFSWTKSTYFSI